MEKEKTDYAVLCGKKKAEKKKEPEKTTPETKGFFKEAETTAEKMQASPKKKYFVLNNLMPDNSRKRSASRVPVEKELVKGDVQLRILALGGLEEIGKNMTIIECRDEILIIDCGMGFPDNDDLGVQKIIPDMTYLEMRADRIKGLLITHGHEDHVGGTPYFRQKFPHVPIYCTRMSAEIIRHHMDETGDSKAHIKVIKSGGSPFNIGKNFKVEAIKVNHSIAGAVAYAIHTPYGTLVHTGDFKIDETPTMGRVFDFAKFKELGEKGVKLLMCDSTNAMKGGHTKSESLCRNELFELFKEHPDERLIISTFSSNMYRIQSIIDAAEANGRKICFLGRSMVGTFETCRELGYIKMHDDPVEFSNVDKFSDKEIVIITTGSQGEQMSGLYRMVNGMSGFDLGENDLIILSSHTIPGNEKTVNEIINKSMKMGAKIITDGEKEIHASGHACQEELKKMHELLKPEYFLPVHGEVQHMVTHRNLAVEWGMDKSKTIITEIGIPVEITKEGIRHGKEVVSGSVLIDNTSMTKVDEHVLRDRQVLSTEGIVVISIPINVNTKKLDGEIHIVSRGCFYMKDSALLMKNMEFIAAKAVTGRNMKKEFSWKEIREDVEDKVSKYLKSSIGKRPTVAASIVRTGKK